MKRPTTYVMVIVGVALVAILTAAPANAQCFPAGNVPPCCATSALVFTFPSPPPPPYDFVWVPGLAGCPALFDVAAGDLRTAWNAKIVGPGMCLPGEDAAPGLAAVGGVPPLNEGFWYLSRSDDLTWNSLDAFQVVDRDAALAGICPL